MIKIVILGAGNVGTHLFRVFTEAKEVEVVQWYNRSLDHIQLHRDTLAVTDQLDALMEADVYLLALSDDAIPITAKDPTILRGAILDDDIETKYGENRSFMAYLTFFQVTLAFIFGQHEVVNEKTTDMWTGS